MRFLLVCLLVVLVGCSDPAASPEPAETSTSSDTAEVDEAAIRSGLATAFAGGSPTAQADCFADEVVAATTPEELREAGVLDEEYAVAEPLPPLPRELAEKVVSAQLTCTDFVAASTRAGTYVTKGRLDRERYERCLRRELSESQVREALVAGVMGDWESPALARLATAQADCATN